ncbi:hypothetical protein [Parapedobacter pyrenivorans]|nr:hypothetical protein [Parapedobacter pyrenivorans]
MNFDSKAQSCAGTIMENPMPLQALFGLLSADEEDEPKVPKCGFTPL